MMHTIVAARRAFRSAVTVAACAAHGGGGPGSGIGSEMGWFLDGSYVVIVLGNYDLPGAPAIYQKLIGFLASQ